MRPAQLPRAIPRPESGTGNAVHEIDLPTGATTGGSCKGFVLDRRRYQVRTATGLRGDRRARKHAGMCGFRMDIRT